MTLVPGQALSHYRLVEHIGAGGMGEVYPPSCETIYPKAWRGSSSAAWRRAWKIAFRRCANCEEPSVA